jgi:hypothetical protein
MDGGGVYKAKKIMFPYRSLLALVPRLLRNFKLKSSINILTASLSMIRQISSGSVS